MSKYSQAARSISRACGRSALRERGGKVRAADFAPPYRKGSGIAGWLDSLPHILAGDSFRAVVEAMAAARARQRAIVWGLGGHVIKCGLAPVLIDLMQRGYATAFAMNGVGLHPRFRNRPGRAHQRGRGSGAARWPLRRGGRDRPRNESRHRRRRPRRDLGMGEALGALAGDASAARSCRALSLLLQAYRHRDCP